MTRENAVRKLMEVARDTFNNGRGVQINDIPFYNFGCKLEMQLKMDSHDNIHSVAIMLGESTVTYFLGDMIKEIFVDFSNTLEITNEKTYGWVNGEYFRIMEGGE